VQRAVAQLWTRPFGNEDEAFASVEFSQLARQCHAAYGAPDWTMRHSNHGERESSYLEWHEQNLRTAFRNVGAPWYGSMHPDPEEISDVIAFAYKGGVSKRIYLAPLDQAPAHMPRSEFGPCRMGRFSGEELTDIVDNAVLGRFQHDELEIEKLAQLSWLVVEERANFQPAAERDIVTQVLSTKLDTDTRVVTHAPAFPAIVERILLVLMLYPWEDFVKSTENWRPFLVPWVHPVNMDPLISATPPPSVDSLSWQLDYCPTPDGDLIEFELPLARRMKNEAFDDFQAKLFQIWRTLEKVCSLGHRFSSTFSRWVEHFLLRGYLEEGIDELIMHMTGVDAAIGSRNYRRVTNYKSMTKAIAGRLKNLLNDGAAAAEFERLYDVRSAYIHGRHQDGTILASDLLSARKLARRAAQGVLEYAIGNPGATRDQMLDELDRAKP
jgi:hypothetical protein